MKLKLFENRYQGYVFIYQLLLLAYEINPTIFPKELTLIYLFPLILIERKFIMQNTKILILFSALTLISGLLFFIRDYYANGTLILHFFSLFFIVQCYYHGHIGTKIHKVLIIIYCLFVFIQLARGIDANFILTNRSRNMVSLYLMIFVMFYYIEDYRRNGKIKLWPGLVSMLISLLMIGRGGIIASGLLLFSVSSLKYYFENKIKRLKLIVGSLLLVVALMIFFGSYFIEFMGHSLERFNKMGTVSTQRAFIFHEYMRLLTFDFKNFMFGFPLDDYVFKLFDLNLHNSYLSLHYFLGGFGLIVIFLIFKCLFTRGMLLYRCLLLVLLVRGVSDQIFFFSFNDVIIFYLIFLILKPRPLSVVYK